MADIILRQNLNQNLVLHDKAGSPLESVVADVFFRYESDVDREPVYLGSAPAGKTLKVPFDIPSGEEIRFFVVSRTENGEQSVHDPKEGVQTLFNPNLESLTPFIWKSSAASNTSVAVSANSFTNKTKYRRVKLSSNSDMSGASSVVINEFPMTETTIVNKPSSVDSETRYITFEHSSNNIDWSPTSNILEVVFANDTGGGGDPLEEPPCFEGDTPFVFIDETRIRFEDLYIQKHKYISQAVAKSYDNDKTIVAGVVDDVFRHWVHECLVVEFESGQIFGVTKEHPFYTELNDYYPVGQMSEGFPVQGDCIKSIRLKQSESGFWVYNARIREFHNYTVGDSSEKDVHNAKNVNF